MDMDKLTPLQQFTKERTECWCDQCCDNERIEFERAVKPLRKLSEREKKMCGIFGWSSQSMSTVQRAVLATNLGRLNDSRGGQSWGYVSVGKKIQTRKGLGDIVEASIGLSQHPILFGHTRFATTGAVIAKNSHPFQIGDILGAHNGIVYNHHTLCTKYNRAFAVDSMHLFAHLDEELPFHEIEGYGAIEWIDRKKPERIYLSRLKGGELSIRGIGTFEKPRGIVWSSDDKHLAEACAAADLTTFEYSVEVGVVLYVENHKLLVSPDLTLTLGETTMTRSWKDGMWDEEPDEATMGRWARFAEERGLNRSRWAKGQHGIEEVKSAEASAAVLAPPYVNDGSSGAAGEAAAFFAAKARLDAAAAAKEKATDSAKLWPEKDVWKEYQEQAANSAADAEMDARIAALDEEIDLTDDVPLDDAARVIDAESVANWLAQESESYSAK